MKPKSRKSPKVVGTMNVTVNLPAPPSEATVRKYKEKYHKRVTVIGMYGNKEWRWPFIPHLFDSEEELRKDAKGYIEATGNSISIFKRADGKYVFFPHEGSNGPLNMVAKHFGAEYVDDITCLSI